MIVYLHTSEKQILWWDKIDRSDRIQFFSRRWWFEEENDLLAADDRSKRSFSFFEFSFLCDVFDRLWTMISSWRQLQNIFEWNCNFTKKGKLFPMMRNWMQMCPVSWLQLHLTHFRFYEKWKKKLSKEKGNGSSINHHMTFTHEDVWRKEKKFIFMKPKILLNPMSIDEQDACT